MLSMVVFLVTVGNSDAGKNGLGMAEMDEDVFCLNADCACIYLFSIIVCN